MALRIPFRRTERFPVAQGALAAVEQRLPGQRRESWWSRPFGRVLLGVLVGGVALATVAAFALRQRATDALADQDAAAERGLASTRTEAYDAHRADADGDVDSVQEATRESFPASDAPVWGSGPDVPIIREGEHKEELPYQPR